MKQIVTSLRSERGIAGPLVLAACLGAAIPVLGASARTASREMGELLTPPGITLEPLGRDQGYGGGGLLARERLAFADSKGMTLYTYDLDPPGKSACVDEAVIEEITVNGRETRNCQQSWLPAVPAAGVKGFGPWSVITRADGIKQWAYKGKALYTFVKDVDPGSAYGASPANGGPKRKNAAGQIVGRDPSYLGGGGRRREASRDAGPPKDWKIAGAFPVTGIKLPVGFAVKEVQDAFGLVLVDYRKMTLYAYAGDPNKDKHGPKSLWSPAEAPQIAQPLGDFNFVVRDDGVKQWTYKGKALYTYAGDPEASFANGIGVDKQYDVAAVYRYYVPPNIKLFNSPTNGKILATADGLTLYRREAHSVGQTHGLRRSQAIRPAVGRDIGIHPVCVSACEMWHPYRAPDGLQAQGQWTVDVHPDGFRQLAYQGYALWTYDGDKTPGDVMGNEDYDIDFLFSGMATDEEPVPDQPIDLGTPQDGPAALYWSVVEP